MENETYYCLLHERQEDASKFPKCMQKEGGYCNEAIQEYLDKKTQGRVWLTPISVYCNYHQRKEDISLFYPNDIQKRKKVACIRSKKIYVWWYALQKKDDKGRLVYRNRKVNKESFLQFLSEIESLVESGKYTIDNIKGSLHEHFSQNKPDMVFCWNHMQYEPSHWFWESQFNKTVTNPKCKSSISAWRDFVKIQPKRADGMMTAPKSVLRKEFTQKYLPSWEVENAEEVALLRSKDTFIDTPMFVPTTNRVKESESVSDTQNIETHDPDAMTVEEAKALNQPECFSLPGVNAYAPDEVSVVDGSGLSENIEEDVNNMATPMEDPVKETLKPPYRMYKDLQMDLKDMEIEINRLNYVLNTRDEVIARLNQKCREKADEVSHLSTTVHELNYARVRLLELVSELSARLLGVDE